MAEWLPLVGIGLLLGVVLGLTGAGGSILAVPLLMAGLGWELSRAAPLALTAVAVSAAYGAWMGWRQKLVRYRAAALMATTGLLCAPVGLWLAHCLSHRWLLGLFVLLMTVAAVRLWRQTLEAELARGAVSAAGEDIDESICRLNPGTGRLRWSSPCAAVLTVTGAFTGLLSGLLGVGGGFVLVPVLRQVTELSIHSAVATSLLFVTLVSSGGVIAAAVHGSLPPASQAAPFVASAVIGMLLGQSFAPRLAGPGLQRAFALVLLLIAATMAIREFH